jgi:hypothetical protein
MASAMVFVDDAVLGRLPPVCAKTGIATVDRLIVTVPVGRSEGLGIAWLLILAGPIGWLGVLIDASARRQELLTVRLPYCDAAYNELARARRVRRGAGFASALFAVAFSSWRLTQTGSRRTAAQSSRALLPSGSSSCTSVRHSTSGGRPSVSNSTDRNDESR